MARTDPDGSASAPACAEPSDEVLARRAGLGDRAAFEVLVRRHGGALYRFVLRIVLDTHDADDCVQDTFEAAWKHVAAFRGEAAVRTWLFTIARRQAMAVLRRGRRSQERRWPASGSRPPATADGVEQQLAEVPALDPGPADELEVAQLRAALDGALLLLPERQRSAWMLRELELLSYQQVAAVLGTSQTAVRGLLERGRRTLAAAMQEWR